MRTTSAPTALAALSLLAGLGAALFIPGAEAAAPPAQPGKRAPRDVAAVIDREVEGQLAEAKLKPGPLADDAEFLRRVCLDLTGRIPTADRARTFLADKRPDRRAKLVDELLASPEYAQHLARLWARLIAAEEPPQRPILEKWLAGRFAANDGWDRTVTAMLTATGKGPETGFVLSNVENKQPQPNKLAGSAAKLFLGVQLQCAECHRHPFASWEQDEFWGVAAFFGKTRVQAKGEPIGVAEVAAPVKGKAVKIKGPSIVVPATAGKAAGRVVAAKFLAGKKPDLGDDEPHRPALAAWLTAKDNPYFARAAVNRTWGRLFGRGLVNPVDDMHDGNEATHPALLRALAGEFSASGFDHKHLLRCICDSKAYQRTSKGADEEHYARMPVKVMTPDALYDSLCLAMGVKELRVAAAATLGSGRGGTRAAGKESPRERFVKAFETAEPETTPVEYTHGIPQALSLLNEPITNHGAPVIDALLKKSKKPDEVIEGLFLALLSRRPTEAEAKNLAAHVAKRPSAAKGYADVLWALINSPEFALIP